MPDEITPSKMFTKVFVEQIKPIQTFSANIYAFSPSRVTSSHTIAIFSAGLPRKHFPPVPKTHISLGCSLRFLEGKNRSRSHVSPGANHVVTKTSLHKFIKRQKSVRPALDWCWWWRWFKKRDKIYDIPPSQNATQGHFIVRSNPCFIDIF